MRPLTLGEQQFLQLLSSRPCSTEDQVAVMYESSILARHEEGGRGNPRSSNDSIGRINNHIEKLGLAVKMVCLGPNVRYYALVNKLCDDVAKSFATSRGALEVAYFKLILEKIVEDGNSRDGDEPGTSRQSNYFAAGCKGFITELDIKNLRTDLPDPHRGKLSAYAAERTMRSFVSEEWLVPRGNGSLQIGPRTYMELPELLNQYGLDDIPQIIVHLSR
mmetsp:Transcript_35544/g.69992  ORF Transcript_35544/g.69992 Transcript_35544/m.69992 type:complete len:219 (+) Transcript_35544:138-794(+)